MSSGSSGIRGSQWCQVSLRTYIRVLHYMIMGQLIPTRHHISNHNLYDSYPLTY